MRRATTRVFTDLGAKSVRCTAHGSSLLWCLLSLDEISRVCPRWGQPGEERVDAVFEWVFRGVAPGRFPGADLFFAEQQPEADRYEDDQDPQERFEQQKPHASP
jgi:hypothetical protein